MNKITQLQETLIEKAKSLNGEELIDYLKRVSISLAEFYKLYAQKSIEGDEVNDIVKVVTDAALEFTYYHICRTNNVELPYFKPDPIIPNIEIESNSFEVAITRIGILLSGASVIKKEIGVDVLNDNALDSVLLLQFNNCLMYAIRDHLPSESLSKQMIAMKAAKESNELLNKILYVNNLFE